MDGMNCVRIGTVGIKDVGRGSLNYHHMPRIYVLSTGNLKVNLSHVNVGELSAELETIQDISGSARRVCVCMCACLYIHMHTHARMYMCTHTRTNTHKPDIPGLTVVKHN